MPTAIAGAQPGNEHGSLQPGMAHRVHQRFLCLREQRCLLPGLGNTQSRHHGAHAFQRLLQHSRIARVACEPAHAFLYQSRIAAGDDYDLMPARQGFVRRGKASALASADDRNTHKTARNLPLGTIA